MKKFKLTATLACVGLFAGCTTPLGNLGRAFPDGSSFTIDEVNLQASMTGSGSMVLKGVRCVGTNGFAILSTNSAPVIVPTGAFTITPPTAQLAQPSPRSAPRRTPPPKTGPPYNTPNH